jgi:hypothetical protein
MFTNPSVNVDIAAVIEQFNNTEKTRWEVNGIMLSDYLHQIVIPVVQRYFEDAAKKSDSITAFFNKNPIKLMIPVTNFWMTNRLIMDYCKQHHIPIFMIINGLLNVDFTPEAKDSDWVNCYSESIRREYYKDSETALALGDPRMDIYANYPKREINREIPTIIIGAAGFDVTDLNSYLAYEFDFLYDILKAIEAIIADGKKCKLILKVRANGYTALYKSFINEYFPDFNIKIEQTAPFREVIVQGDLYITFYSQTVFEASCIGIPAIYYRKDNQFLHAPFDGKSELCTAEDVGELKNLIQAFYSKDDCFNKFLDKKIMEQYIGHLDGDNVRRNVDFIHSLISKDKHN